ncbi:DNA polymerase III subunit delta' C-terminal domain-containing protein [Buchnera aphidicola]|uniref:DNA polymerase III subunit delta' C-terminal domain-containing protein n=1 Tax=Buchnera aphidicola TaxID=9 RepID=UPI0031B8A7A9
MIITLHPWLTQLYKNIVLQYQKGKPHHAILINTHRGIGVLNLVNAITCWLLCTEKKNIYFCGSCHGCQLMLSNNHPDYYQITLKKNKKTFGIELIRDTIHKISYTSQQGGEKVINISDIAYITPQGICALLKNLEEPPKNTWFLLINYNTTIVPNTLSSRCISYFLPPPIEYIGLNWLKKYNNTYNKNHEISLLTALRISEGSPIIAKKILYGKLWSERTYFFIQLNKAVNEKNFFHLLSIFKKKKINIIFYINWICFFLLDIIKWKYNLYSSIINLDQKQLIQYYSNNYSIQSINNTTSSWIQCRFQLINVIGINYELLLTKELLKWELE